MTTVGGKEEEDHPSSEPAAMTTEHATISRNRTAMRQRERGKVQEQPVTKSIAQIARTVTVERGPAVTVRIVLSQVHQDALVNFREGEQPVTLTHANYHHAVVDSQRLTVPGDIS